MGSVLLIDDSHTVQTAAEYSLLKNSDGLTLVKASSLTEAIAQANQNKPDILLIDHSLEGKNAFALVAELRNHIDLSGTPILVLTSKHMVLDKQKTMAAGITGSVPKPFASSVFLNALKSALNSKPANESVVKPENKPSSPLAEPAPKAAPIADLKKLPPHVSQPEIPANFNQAAIEKMLRQVVEEAVWEVVPDLAEKVIREEIERLLKN